jgi:hypothetical protein
MSRKRKMNPIQLLFEISFARKIASLKVVDENIHYKKDAIVVPD